MRVLESYREVIPSGKSPWKLGPQITKVAAEPLVVMVLGLPKMFDHKSIIAELRCLAQ